MRHLVQSQCRTGSLIVPRSQSSSPLRLKACSRYSSATIRRKDSRRRARVAQAGAGELHHGAEEVGILTTPPL